MWIPDRLAAPVHPRAGSYYPLAPSLLEDGFVRGARSDYSSCQGVRMRGPSSVTATVNSKWAASEPSAE